MQTWFVGPWELSAATAALPPTPGMGPILLVESPAKGSALPYHRKKLVLVLSALRHFRDELRRAGHEVDHRVATSYAAGIADHLAASGAAGVIHQEAAEWGIGESLRRLRTADPRVTEVPDRRFLTSRAEFAEWAQGRTLLRMEDFYRWQRKRLGVLVDAKGRPEGGEWNYDQENRKTASAARKQGAPPRPIGFAPDAITQKVIRLVDSMPNHWGSTDGFDLPVTQAQAEAALDDFLEHRLANFGPFEDAMLTGEAWLWHSRLSPAMNVGLIHPRTIVERTVAWWEAKQRRATPEAARALLASVEGFLRQVIGWREYINGIYWLTMPGYRERNYFGFTRPLPQGYWEPELLPMACVRDAVATVKAHGYAHHIPRLMVLGNFANLVGVHPMRLSEWFWAGFTDAMEWVELPNVVGMATFADGGLLASKPYVSAAAYIKRMGDYCGGCQFNSEQRTGPDACPFNYLYWTFLDDIRTRKLDVGQRMALVMKALDRITPTELAAMHSERERFLATLAPDRTGWQFHYDQG